MSFTGNEDHLITLAEGAELTANYRTAHPGAIKGEYFGMGVLNLILGQYGCVGIRIYYGRDSIGIPRLVIVGVDSNEDDMDLGLIAEKGKLCPPHCGKSNPLNS